MFYIRTADRLVRTARWIEGFEGGIEKLKRIILDDELGICADLDKEMDALVGTYVDEWAVAVADPKIRQSFRQFANTVRSIFPSFESNTHLVWGMIGRTTTCYREHHRTRTAPTRRLAESFPISEIRGQRHRYFSRFLDLDQTCYRRRSLSH